MQLKYVKIPKAIYFSPDAKHSMEDIYAHQIITIDVMPFRFIKIFEIEVQS